MADGKQFYCKPCQNKRNQESRLRRAARSEECSSGSSEGSEESTEAVPAGYDLYVMTNSRIPDEYKVGRSKGVEQRREDMQNGQNFKMVVVATFPGAGYAEGLVHDRLAHSRPGPSCTREWARRTCTNPSA